MNLCICAMLSFVMQIQGIREKTATVLSLFRIAKMTIGRPFRILFSKWQLHSKFFFHKTIHKSAIFDFFKMAVAQKGSIVCKLLLDVLIVALALIVKELSQVFS